MAFDYNGISVTFKANAIFYKEQYKYIFPPLFRLLNEKYDMHQIEVEYIDEKSFFIVDKKRLKVEIDLENDEVTVSDKMVSEVYTLNMSESSYKTLKRVIYRFENKTISEEIDFHKIILRIIYANFQYEIELPCTLDRECILYYDLQISKNSDILDLMRFYFTSLIKYQDSYDQTKVTSLKIYQKIGDNWVLTEAIKIASKEVIEYYLTYLKDDFIFFLKGNKEEKEFGFNEIIPSFDYVKEAYKLNTKRERLLYRRGKDDNLC